jgi:hypothetical protein
MANKLTAKQQKRREQIDRFLKWVDGLDHPGDSQLIFADDEQLQAIRFTAKDIRRIRRAQVRAGKIPHGGGPKLKPIEELSRTGLYRRKLREERLLRKE